MLLASGGTARDEHTAEVRERAIARRERFYAAKMNYILRNHAHAVLDVVHQATSAKTPVTKTDVVRWAKKSMHEHDPLAQGFTNDDALELVEHIREQGFLHFATQDQADVPMPSLRDWLTGRYAENIGWQAPRCAECLSPGTGI